MYTKEEVRKIVKGYRQALSNDDAALRSISILNKLFETEQYKQAECVYCYIDFRNEVKTMPLVRKALKDGKRVAAPRISDDDVMEFYYIHGHDELEEGSFGIMEPSMSCEQASETDALMIMPGMAFDKENHRIGFGGGYYDRYLERENTHFKIALAYQFQIFEQVPYEPHDICPDMVISDM